MRHTPPTLRTQTQENQHPKPPHTVCSPQGAPYRKQARNKSQRDRDGVKETQDKASNTAGRRMVTEEV